jgi:hypothetical protein
MNRATWWRALGGPHAISWVSALLSAGLALSSALWLVRNYPVSDSDAIVGQTAGFTALLLVLLIARFTWLRPTAMTRPRPWATLATFGVASAARVAVLSLIAVGTGEWGLWPAEQTLIFGFMGQVVLLAIVAVSVNAVRASSESIRRLEAARGTIERARTLTEGGLLQRVTTHRERRRHLHLDPQDQQEGLHLLPPRRNTLQPHHHQSSVAQNPGESPRSPAQPDRLRGGARRTRVTARSRDGAQAGDRCRRADLHRRQRRHRLRLALRTPLRR